MSMFVEQKTIKELFENKKSDFLIPDYQRPYAWTEDECLKLWNDVLSFAFPDDNCALFNSDTDEYFLGPIVVFKNVNAQGKLEVIDGQQRLTTFMLLLRAFYQKYEVSNMQDENSINTRDNIGKCIWKTNEFGKPDLTKLKIHSEVATDRDKGEFLEILKTGVALPEQKSKYAENYRFFQARINEFQNQYPTYFSYFPVRILNNCILLPIEAESQDSALRIFSTLNDRGKPLSDADIFKAQFYKHYASIGQKDEFIRRWKQLEELCVKVFRSSSNAPMDELFTRYMYYERAKMGIKNSTTEALRKFYERNDYSLLKNSATFDNLSALALFWKDVANQNADMFSERVLRRLFVLNYAPNSMWAYLVSVYFMQNKKPKPTSDDVDNDLEENPFYLDDAPFYEFLNRITAFIFAYAVTNPGMNALRTPIFAEMLNIVDGKQVTFAENKFVHNFVKNQLDHYEFSNRRPITKSMLVWWAFHDTQQELMDLDTTLEIEHIISKKRQEKQRVLKDSRLLESLGNKSILEKRINIQASDYRFLDKAQYYLGFPKRALRQKRKPTQVHELLTFAQTKRDFVQIDVNTRKNAIINGFLEFMKSNGLFK